VIAILTVIGLVLAIVGSAANLFRLTRTNKKIQEVHVLVNSQLSTVLARVTQLTATLEKSDTEVPPYPPGEEPGANLPASR
jgi:light-regulated signal transduction histidine kinase (bacteriophytochrome)